MLISPLYLFFGEMFLQISYLFFELFFSSLLTYRNSLYILDVSPLTDIEFANIISQPGSLSFHFLSVAFKEQMLLILVKKIRLSIFSFIGHAFLVTSNKSPNNTRSQKFSTCLLAVV